MKLKTQKTTNYNMFKKLKGNRELDKGNLNRLVKSMGEEYLYRPIDVNERYEIIDGQHRAKAAEILLLPIYYNVHKGWGLLQAQRLNVSVKNWVTETFLQSNCDLGKDDYIRFKAHCEKYSQFKFTFLLANAQGNKSKPSGFDRDKFMEGDFKFKDQQAAEARLDLINLVAPYYEKYTSTLFCLALVNCMDVDGFTVPELVKKLKYQSRKMVDCSNRDQYMQLIEEVYNYKRQGKKIRLF